MATPAEQLSPDQESEPYRPGPLEARQGAEKSSEIASFRSLKSQLARAEGSLITKEASLALARDLLRAREQELTRAQHILSERDTRISVLTKELADLRAELTHASAELTKSLRDLSSWRGIFGALVRKWLLLVRYGPEAPARTHVTSPAPPEFTPSR